MVVMESRYEDGDKNAADELHIAISSGIRIVRRRSQVS